MDTYSWIKTAIFTTLILQFLYTTNLFQHSGEFAQEQWSLVLDCIGGDEFTVWFYVTPMLLFVTYWVIGLLYTFMDVTLKPEALRRYKIQPGTNEPVEATKLSKTIGVVLFNQLIVSAPMPVMLYYLQRIRGHPSPRELPTLLRFATDFILLIILYEFAFYYTHRLMHHPLLYKHIHKRHHEWTSPISITAAYAHPIEHILCNILPLFYGVHLLGSHVITAWTFYVYLLFGTLTDHSGYHLPLPFLQLPEFHDYHHLKFNQCYGAIGLLDKLHGTDHGYRSPQQTLNVGHN